MAGVELDVDGCGNVKPCNPPTVCVVVSVATPLLTIGAVDRLVFWYPLSVLIVLF